MEKPRRFIQLDDENVESVDSIVVTGNVSFSTSNGPTPNSSTYSGGENHVFTVLVTGKTTDVGMNIKKDYNNLGPTVYENITPTKNKDSENLTYFCTNGYPLTIGEDVTYAVRSSPSCITTWLTDPDPGNSSHAPGRVAK